VARKPLEVYHDEASGLYFTKADNGEFIRSTRQDMVTELKTLGYSDTKEKLGVSVIDETLQKIRKGSFVRWAGALAGHWAGATTTNGKLILVTENPSIIKATYGTDHTVWNFFRRLLGDEQAKYFFAWLKVGRESLLNQTFRRGPGVILVGQKNHGKTLTGWLLKKCLGDRSTDPTQVAQAITTFNAHLFGSELIHSDDKGGGQDDYHSQKKTRELFCTLTADKTPQLHGKHKTPITIDRVFWRLLYTLNDGAEHLKVLPALDREFMDKVMIFQTVGRGVDEPTNTESLFRAFEVKMLAAIPDFLGQLERWRIPASVLTHADTVDRWGHDVYHNAEVLSNINGGTPEARLLELVDEVEGFDYGRKYLVRDIENLLREHDLESVRHLTKKLLDGKPENCGNYLSRLLTTRPERVLDGKRCKGGKRRYIILAPTEDQNDDE
jgi:hypothetical protein